MTTRVPDAPRSERDLLERAQAIAGQTLGALAEARGMPAPGSTRRAKGWTGQLLEAHLGATAGSRSEPDFQHIGVELKTIPVSPDGKPRESTYVCTVPLAGNAPTDWESSIVRLKLARVLWVPVVTPDGAPMAERVVGWPLLWSPSAEEAAALETDWNELMDMVCLGELDRLSARLGTCLQIRPKAANASARRWGVGETGEPVRTVPRGFYLRAAFTERILRRNYAIPP